MGFRSAWRVQRARKCHALANAAARLLPAPRCTPAAVSLGQTRYRDNVVPANGDDATKQRLVTRVATARRAARSHADRTETPADSAEWLPVWGRLGCRD